MKNIYITNNDIHKKLKYWGKCKQILIKTNKLENWPKEKIKKNRKSTKTWNMKMNTEFPFEQTSSYTITQR